MKREIKFRGLRTDGKGWVYGFYRENSFYNKLGDEPILIYKKHFIGTLDNLNHFNGIFEQVEVIPESVGQFTGLKDKNGKECYEGDILMTITGICSVIWDDAGFALLSPGSEAICYEHSSVYEASEIIGNIHENPELLH